MSAGVNECIPTYHSFVCLHGHLLIVINENMQKPGFKK